MDSRRPKALVGFDGYIDELVRVVEGRDSFGHCVFHTDIPSFAGRVAAAAGKSADIELATETVKIGGNAPIMANALALLDVDTVCIGAMGYPRLNPVFLDMSEKCRCISVCGPASTCALEFDDGKLMLGNLKELEELNWALLKERVGLEELSGLFEEAELIALVNWSGVQGTAGIWKGVLDEIFPGLSADRRKLFLDLADPSGRSKADIQKALEQIGAFAEYCDVILGLNENEALCVHRVLGGEQDRKLEEVGKELYEQIGVKAVVIHPVDRCIAVTEEGVICEKGHLVRKPRCSTGGGDNFNAGFCAGLLKGWGIRNAMRLGMEVSGYYVQNGCSPSWENLSKQL